jgi:dihydrodipicolinate synthase/N-acetylneuraminate lyase
MRIDWKGIYPALSTPCDDNGTLDEESLRNEVRWNIEMGTHGLIVSIMSGEFHKFSIDCPTMESKRKHCGRGASSDHRT